MIVHFGPFGKKLICRALRPLISYTNFASYTTENKPIQKSSVINKKDQKSNLPEQSILEQILVKEVQEPQTTGEKGKKIMLNLIMNFS